MRPHPDYNIVICKDSKLLQDEIAALQHKHTEPSRGWNKKVFWGDEPVSDDFWNSFRQQGLFAEPVMIICRKANDWSAAVWKMLSQTLAHPNPSVWTFLCLETEFEKNKYKIPAFIQKTNCFAYASQKGWLKEIPPLSGKNLQKYVETELKKLKLNLDAEFLANFLNFVTPDANAINNELQKFVLLQDAGISSKFWLNEQLGVAENNVFMIIDGLQNGKLNQIWEIAAQTGQNNFLFLLLAILAREFRMLWQILQNEAGAQRIYDYAKKRQLAEKIGKDNLAQGFALLADAEWQVKSGARSPEQTLEFLLIQLLGIFKNKSWELNKKD